LLFESGESGLGPGSPLSILDAMKVAALQFDVQRAATDPTAPAHNLAAAESAVRAAAAAGARLVVLPEVWATSFPAGQPAGDAALLAAAEEATAMAASWSAELNLVIAGSYLAPAAGLGQGAGGRFYNRLLVHDGGELRLSYDKVHLFTPTAEHEVFAAGAELPPVVETSAGRLSGAICYDLRFPELFVPMRRAEVDLVVVPAQWAARRADHWRALVLGRAVEGQFTVVAANRTGSEPLGQRGQVIAFPGNSLVASAAGEALAEGRGEVGAILGLVDPELGHKQRIRVPVGKDRRGDLYDKWRAADRT
jgi:predicted amidohydrolase